MSPSVTREYPLNHDQVRALMSCPTLFARGSVLGFCSGKYEESFRSTATPLLISARLAYAWRLLAARRLCRYLSRRAVGSEFSLLELAQPNQWLAEAQIVGLLLAEQARRHERLRCQAGIGSRFLLAAVSSSSQDLNTPLTRPVLPGGRRTSGRMGTKLCAGRMPKWSEMYPRAGRSIRLRPSGTGDFWQRELTGSSPRRVSCW